MSESEWASAHGRTHVCKHIVHLITSAWYSHSIVGMRFVCMNVCVLYACTQTKTLDRAGNRCNWLALILMVYVMDALMLALTVQNTHWTTKITITQHKQKKTNQQKQINKQHTLYGWGMHEYMSVWNEFFLSVDYFDREYTSRVHCIVTYITDHTHVSVLRDGLKCYFSSSFLPNSSFFFFSICVVFCFISCLHSHSIKFTPFDISSRSRRKKYRRRDKLVRWQSRFPVATTNAKSQKYETQIEYESEAEIFFFFSSRQRLS